MFTRRFDRRVYVALGVFMFSVVLGSSFGAYILWPSRREAGYAPEQPIPYSHRLHAGDLKINCLYCHRQAKRGPNATIPPVSTCMKCHAEVRPKNKDGKLTSGIATLLKHWEQNRPIIWNKVNCLADFAYFDHSRHVVSGVECNECHGPVETMEVMRREHGLKMSWCLDCHKSPLPEDSRRAELGWPTRASTTCTTCHR